MIATIDPEKHVVEVSNLLVTASFFNKRNINAQAKSALEAIFNPKRSYKGIATHPESKAEALLDLVPKTDYKQAYTIILKNKRGVEYARLVPSKDGGVKLGVTDRIIFLRKAGNKESLEGQLLRAVTRQAVFGSKAESEKRVSESQSMNPDLGSFDLALNRLFPKKSMAKKLKLANQIPAKIFKSPVEAKVKSIVGVLLSSTFSVSISGVVVKKKLTKPSHMLKD